MKDVLTSKNFLVSSLIISIIYLLVITYLMNFDLVKDAFFGEHTLSYRINILLALLGGMWTAMSGFGLAILVITSILTGINLTLTAQRLNLLKSLGNLHFIAGGGSLLGIIGSGCAACGLPILALLGLSGSIAYLPFRGTEFSFIAVILLSMSLFFLVRSNNQKMTCAVNIKTTK